MIPHFKNVNEELQQRKPLREPGSGRHGASWISFFKGGNYRNGGLFCLYKGTSLGLSTQEEKVSYEQAGKRKELISLQCGLQPRSVSEDGKVASVSILSQVCIVNSSVSYARLHCISFESVGCLAECHYGLAGRQSVDKSLGDCTKVFTNKNRIIEKHFVKVSK